MIYTVGDSFTYGQELPNPQEQAWPTLLANKLNKNLVNEGRGGAGNDFIVKKTIQAIAKYRPEIVIIAWTSFGRKEFADEHGPYTVWPGIADSVFGSDPKLSFRMDLVKYITLYNNELYEYRCWLRQVILLQNYLQNNNIDYIMCNVFDNQKKYDVFSNDNKEYYDLIDKDRFIGWPKEAIIDWVYGTPHGPGGHPLEQGHQIIANKILERLQ
jgi:hypothetical protein